ncbi:hypothetical protein QLT00_gp59 [Gordonia phage Commandaria]|uniref:Uncharacterized protein n=1 Tax=Gordonia phage Commandaria TaxID=3038364 RepID=A0AAF0K076_9CAUD|nr:hypothetical protein QLT00_gp59 [Gordonia phage Commandaria]WGH20842.1 hypothetical protein [Gordonia phage Commandaria]
MDTHVKVYYSLRYPATGDVRSIVARYDIVGTGFRVPGVGERIRRDGRSFLVERVTWDLDSPAHQQEVDVVATEV